MAAIAMVAAKVAKAKAARNDGTNFKVLNQKLKATTKQDIIEANKIDFSNLINKAIEDNKLKD